MSFSIPEIRVFCDGRACNDDSRDRREIVWPLNCLKDQYDRLGLTSYLKKQGWEVIHSNSPKGEHYCPDCAKELKQQPSDRP